MNTLKYFQKKKVSRTEKRQFVVHLSDRDVRIMDYIDTLALKISILYPNSITKREAFKAIYRAFMKSGKPKHAKRKAAQLLRDCQLKAIKGWHNRVWFRIVFAWLQLKQFRKKLAFV